MSGPPPPEPLPPDVAAQNKGPMMLALVWTFTSIATLFVAGRLFSRRRKLGRIFLDDYIIILSMILAFIFLGFVTVSIHYGSGRHAATLAIPDLEKAIMYITLGFVPGILSFTVPKFAVVMLLCNLLNPSRLHKWFLWIMACINFLAIIACIVVVYASCDPPYAMWTLSVKAKCWNPSYTVNTSLFAGAFAAFLDLYLAIYPAVVLFRLQINLRKKIGLSVALGFGVCAGAVAIHKCTTIPGVGNKTDFTYGTEDLVLWTNIEANCVIIAACVPMLLPLMEAIFGKTFMSSAKKNSDYYRFRDGSRPQIDSQPWARASRKTGTNHSKSLDTATDENIELGIGISKTEISSNTSDDLKAGDSQERILTVEEAASRNGDGRIVRHDSVVVQYEARGGKQS